MKSVDLEELMIQAFDEGGITIFCECGNEFFVEPDGFGWCDNCRKTVANPLVENGLI